jgi:hypothetical protein
MTIIVFHSLFNCSNKSIISSEVLVSNAQVGSSASIIVGEITKAQATDTLCFCPQEISFGIFFSFHFNQTFSNAFIAKSVAFLFDIP